MHTGENPDVPTGFPHRIDQSHVLFAQVHVLAPKTTDETFSKILRVCYASPEEAVGDKEHLHGLRFVGPLDVLLPVEGFRRLALQHRVERLQGLNLAGGLGVRDFVDHSGVL